jgi:hypothetical protein
MAVWSSSSISPLPDDLMADDGDTRMRGRRRWVAAFGDALWELETEEVVGQGKEKSPMEKGDARGRGDGPNLQGGDPSGLMPRSRIGRKKLWAE